VRDELTNLLLPQDSTLQPVILFYPEYYRSLVVRLYNFDGIQAIPKSCMVISYQEKVSRDGIPYKEITSAKSFSSYEEAEAYISSQKSTNYRIVGTDPKELHNATRWRQHSRSKNPRVCWRLKHEAIKTNSKVVLASSGASFISSNLCRGCSLFTKLNKSAIVLV